MKKIISVVLALALVLTLSATAFAAETVNTVPASKDHLVYAVLVDNTTYPDVYSADITWGEMQFTYTKTGTMDWDKDKHAYVDNTKGTWTATGNTVAVTNHSNKELDVSLKYTANEAYKAVNGTIDSAKYTLPTAVYKAFDDASLTKTSTLTLDGVLPAGVTDFTVVGTVTVTLNEVIYS